MDIAVDVAYLSTKGKYSCHSDANLNMEFVTQECYNKLLMYPINGTSHESYGTDCRMNRPHHNYE